MRHLIFIFILFSCASHEKTNNPEKPQLISLTSKVQASRTHEYIYDEFVMDAPNYSVYQNHEGLRSHFNNQNEISYLCHPSVLATTLIQERQNNKKAKSLKLNGFSKDDKEVDANELVHQLVTCANTNSRDGTLYQDSANCISELYNASNMEADVKLIAILQKKYKSKVSPKIKHEQRHALIQDIVSSLKEGFHVIGLLDIISPDQKGTWKREEGHAVVINGYARQKNWPSDLLYTFISDPSLIYRASEYPRIDQALIVKVSNTKNYPPQIGNLSFEGNSHVGLTSRAILSGLLIYKTK